MRAAQSHEYQIVYGCKQVVDLVSDVMGEAIQDAIHDR